ncbi:hypothetical protein ACJX0J_037179, partial [Zea mays]
FLVLPLHGSMPPVPGIMRDEMGQSTFSIRGFHFFYLHTFAILFILLLFLFSITIDDVIYTSLGSCCEVISYSLS